MSYSTFVSEELKSIQSTGKLFPKVSKMTILDKEIDKYEKRVEDQKKYIQNKIDHESTKLRDLERKNNEVLTEIEKQKLSLRVTAEELKRLLEEHNELKKVEHELQFSQSVEDNKMLDTLKLKHKLYRKMTGVRFDFNAPKNVISGFVGIQSVDPVNNIAVPIRIVREDDNVSAKLWAKVEEACCSIEDIENIAPLMQNTLNIK